MNILTNLLKLGRHWRGLFLAIILLVTSAATLRAQYLPPYVMHGIDSALGAILMTRYDMAMRWDYYTNDPHRLQVIKRLFGDPLATFEVSDSLAAALNNNYADPLPAFQHIGNLLDLGTSFLNRKPPIISDVDTQLFTKIDLNLVDFSTAIILRKFLTLAVAIDIQVIENRQLMTSPQFQRLVEYSDSLILQSEGAGNASLVEMKMAERYGLIRSRQFFDSDAANIDYGRLLTPGANLYMLALDFARKMEGEIPNYRDSIKTKIWNTPIGRVAIGGATDDVYEGDFFLIVDIGGNDIYRDAQHLKSQVIEHGTKLIVDFAGDDTYIGSDYSLGGTLFGASTLLDMKGNDNYTANNFALGCGYFGVGVLHDEEGSDRYSGGTAVEGAGLFGIGLLIDGKGNDNYLAHLESQGFGFTRGLGAIVERGGNDSYIAASPYTDFLRYDDHFETFCQGAALGSRPVASGGIGIIAEAGGNDTYSCDIYGQGTAYWYGLGAIVDRTGNDNYTAFQYAQGSGVHLAFGALIDVTGSDNYVSHGVSQGCGHDIAFGGLYDAAGDDNYVVESLSLGGGNANAVSLFIDGGGEDGYLARRYNTMGFSDLRREYGMIGIFLDLEGKDFYGTYQGGNDSVWTGSFYGAGIDANLRPADLGLVAESTKEPEKTPEQIEAELGTDLETLFIQASAAPQKFQYIVEPARNRLVALADTSIPFLLTQLNSESARERLALGIILPRIGKRVVPALIDTVRNGDTSRVSQAMYALGEIKDSSAALALGERLVDPKRWWFRASAGEALLKIDATSARPYIKQALTDTVDLVRARAARSLARIGDDKELMMLVPMLDDTSQLVRYQIQIGLQRRGIDSVATFLARALTIENTNYAHALLYNAAKGAASSEARMVIVDGMLESSNDEYRAEGVRLTLKWNQEELLRRATRIKRGERSSIVLFELDKLPELKPEKSTRKKNRDQSEVTKAGKDGKEQQSRKKRK